jgi:2,5-diamino-6-(ribosylamino)-4(3H)-pyrimidinone 5'-phosphate reductase
MKPYLVIHTSVSLDGRVTGFDVDMAAHYRLAGSFGGGATLAGADTLLTGLAAEGIPPDPEASDPNRDSAASSNADSILVVPDSRGRVKHWRWLLGSGYWGGGVALCTARTPADHRAYLERIGVAVIEAGAERVDLAAALDTLAGEHGVERVRADCGGRLAGALLHAGLVDEVSLLVYPVVAGVGHADWYVAPEGATSPPPKLRRTKLEPVGDELVWTVYRVCDGG